MLEDHSSSTEMHACQNAALLLSLVFSYMHETVQCDGKMARPVKRDLERSSALFSQPSSLAKQVT